ncbi:uncharacterized protein ACMZJ9_009935 [Mantella aurantiaca]
MERIVWNRLRDTLEDLDERQFKSFCRSLCDPHEGYNKIPRSSLENVNRKDIVDLIQRTVSYSQGIELAVTILKDINERDKAEILNEYLIYVIQDEVNFINHHSQDLIRQVTVVDPILDDLLQQKLLTQTEYHEIHSNPTSEMKMWELYTYVSFWSDRNKAILYGLLKKHNEQLITSLYHQDKEQRSKLPPPPLPPPLLHEVNFINQHSQDLIRQVTVVDPVLEDLLQQGLLTQKQYHEIRRNPTSQMKMKELYTYVSFWSDRDKAILYGLLKIYNNQLIKSLRDQDKDPRPILPPQREHFVDRHRQDLIQRISRVEPILDSLLAVDLLTLEEYDTICAKETSQGKMRMLYTYITHWSNTDKDTLYRIMKKRNIPVITLLEEEDGITLQKPKMEHFVDRHRDDLIHWVYTLQPVLENLLKEHLLTKEQYDSICSKTTPQGQMVELYHCVGGWGDGDKDKLYDSLRKYNEQLIRGLEDQDMGWFETVKMVHFVDTHREDLIHQVYILQPVLENLLKEHLLTKEQYDSICNKTTPQGKMEELYCYVGGWGYGYKDKLYDSLRKYNEQLIRGLEAQDMRWYEIFSRTIRLSSIKSGSGTSSLVDMSSYLQPGSSKDPDLPTHLMSDPEPSDQSTTTETEPANIFSSHQHDQLECKLCGKDEDSAFLSMPVINGKVYRLELQSAGLFRCSKTGIKFQVTCPVTIEYELEPWSNYRSLIQNLRNKSELLGTLFNIKTDLKPHVVSAVYLPHCLCLKGFKEDISCIKCAHFKDDNLTLETPTRVEPYYVVLEDPTFSPIGVLLYPFMWIKDKIIQLIPFHGMVLIYWKISGITDPKHRKFRIHLYLMPCDQSVEMDIDNQKKKLGYDRIYKPHQTAVLYNRRTYDVKASQNARVLPKTLLFQCSYVMELYPYTEITVGDKETNELIVISIEDGESSLWKAEVDKGDINDLVTAFTGLLRLEVPMESVDEVQAMPIEASMERGRRSCLDLLNNIIGDISNKNFKTFKAYLNDQAILQPYQPISQSDLESADCLEVANLLIRYYTEEKAPDVTIKVLEAIREVNLAKKLKSMMSGR